MITQGKWEVTKGRLYAFSIEAATKTVAYIPTNEEAEDNARLIAAAPDLLEACNALLKTCVCCRCAGWGFDTESNREKATARAKALLAVGKAKLCQKKTDLMGGDKVGDLMNKIT